MDKSAGNTEEISDFGIKVERAFFLSTCLQLEYGLSEVINADKPSHRMLPKAASIIACGLLLAACSINLSPVAGKDQPQAEQCTTQSEVRMRNPEDPNTILAILKDQTHIKVVGSAESYINKSFAEETGIPAEKWSLIEILAKSTDNEGKALKVGEQGIVAEKFIGACANTVKGEEVKKKIDENAEELNRMTLEEKVGQMFMIHISGQELSDEDKKLLEDIKPGGVIIMGDNVSENLSSFIRDIQSTNPDLKLFISIDQEGGEIRRLQEDPHPAASELGKASNGEICESYQRTAEILFNYGINMNFGIVADIASGPDDFIANRSFGTNPQRVADNVHTALSCSEDILNSVKHYPGHGGTTTDSHTETPVIEKTQEEWENTAAKPFEQAVKDNVDVVMVGHIEYPEIATGPASVSKKQIESLRNMGFENLIITDDMGMLEDAGYDSKDSLIKAVKAGNDMLLYVNSELSITELRDYLVEQFKSEELDESQLDESVKRILVEKRKIK